MSLKELITLIKSIGFPVAYHHFEEGHSPIPPYLLYLYQQSENFGADNYSYHKSGLLQIELYCQKKDIQAEEKVETFLDNHFFYFDKIEQYLASEKLYQITYTISI